MGDPKRMVDVGSSLGVRPLLILMFNCSKVGGRYDFSNVIIRHFALKQKDQNLGIRSGRGFLTQSGIPTSQVSWHFASQRF